MAYTIYLSLAVVAICIGVFVNLPPPPLSKRLLEWKERGSVFSWKEKSIFYVHVTGFGQNGDLICLHGFPTSSYDWIKILPDLQKEFRQIVMLDFLGYGFSDKPTDHTYTIGEQADIVEGLSKQLHLDSAHILAHDYGDTVALEMLARHNSGSLSLQMTSLTLTNGGIFREVHHPRLVQKLLLVPVVGFLGSYVFVGPLFCRSLSAVFGVNQPSAEDCEDFWASLRYNDGDNAAYKIINFLRERQQFRDRYVGALVSTKLQVFMIYGPADPVNPPPFADHFRKTVPNQKIVTLDSSIGHYPQWEDPKSVSKAFLDFIHSLALTKSRV